VPSDLRLGDVLGEYEVPETVPRNIRRDQTHKPGLGICRDPPRSRTASPDRVARFAAANASGWPGRPGPAGDTCVLRRPSSFQSDKVEEWRRHPTASTGAVDREHRIGSSRSTWFAAQAMLAMRFHRFRFSTRLLAATAVDLAQGATNGPPSTAGSPTRPTRLRLDR
jgi:hypothetical protein